MKSQTVQVGDPLPDFSLRAADGSTVTPASFRGRPFLLIFYRGHW